MPHPIRASLVALALFVSSSAAACGVPLPDDPAERALYRDMRQIVETRERTGWIIDRDEILAISPTVLQSACQVYPEVRADLIAFIDARIVEEGGPAAAAYRDAGGDITGRVADLLTLERVRAALVDAHTRAEAECPFWLEPDPEFAGVQTSNHRFIIIAESIGGFLVAIQDGTASIGGGGGGRLLPSWGVNEAFTLGVGFEIGGRGSFSESETDAMTGESSDSIDATITGAVPVLFRFHSGTWMFDVEGAVISEWVDDEVRVPPGFRVGFGAGLGAVRIAGLMPQGLGWVGYEFLPPSDDGRLPASHTIRLGTRVGVDFDP